MVFRQPRESLSKGTISLIVVILVLGVFSVPFSIAEAGVVLPRMGAVIELDQVTPRDPWEDRSSRVQWVLARLHCEGLRVWLLDPQKPVTDCEVLYLDGPAFKKALTPLKRKKIGILQSASRKVLGDIPQGEIHQVSPRVSLEYHRTSDRRVVTVRPDLSACFNDYKAVEALGNAILWLAGLPRDVPRVAPFPEGKRSAVLIIVHGEGYPEKMDVFHRTFLDGPGALTYAVSEGAIEKYASVIKTFVKSSRHEVAIHNHRFSEYPDQDRVLSANIELHQKELEGHRPSGLVGPYLQYFDDLREALLRHHFRWFLDKDLPYPLNIPVSSEGEPVIDITESLKPYDGWWRLRDAQGLWRLGLTRKRLHNEIAVCSWHDVHMAKEPAPFLEFMQYVKEMPDVWQTTASSFQAFWRDRWRGRVEILASDDRFVTVRTSGAPPGLTLMRNRRGQKEIAVLEKESRGSTKLEWRLLKPIHDQPVTEPVQIKWGKVGSAMIRGGLDTEFALIHGEGRMLADESLTVPLPEEIRTRMSKMLPTTLRVSIYGIKGLKFKDIKMESIAKGQSVPENISFTVDLLPEQSIQFYRLRFPIPEKLGRMARLRHSVRKHPIATAALGIVFLGITFLLLRRALFPHRIH